jgi:hypothetical protein
MHIGCWVDFTIEFFMGIINVGYSLILDIINK